MAKLKEIKKILQKIVNPSRKDWSSVGSPYWIVFSKAYHLPLSSAIWPTTKSAKKGNFSCKNWWSFTWKHMNTPGSTNKKLKLIVVELKDETTNNTFQVNGHQLKIFHEGLVSIVGKMESILLMEPAMPDDTP
ncbi:hypothetical protein CR513_32562, partial [Mucuna pruriens]